MPQRDAIRDRLFDGRYRMLGPIGSGGMATVYAAEDEVLGRRVAIKVLAERYVEDHQFVERFRREAQAAAGLNHPNIVAIYDRGETDGTYYIAMELLDGRSLKDVIVEEAPLEPARAIDYALQVLSALRYAHRHGVVHRDIKPHNILVGYDGRLKVTDFGIAHAGTSQMTEVGSIIGTAQYISPEQARGQLARPPADIYSLGVVLYEMLTGRVPFEGDGAVAIAMRHVSEPPRPPSRLVRSVPPALEQVVLRALAKDPSQRYASADEMALDLERVRRGGQASAETQRTALLVERSDVTQVVPPPTDGTRIWRAPVPAQPAAAPPQRRRPVWPWIVVLVLLLAAAAVAALALPGLLGGSSSATVPSGLEGQTYTLAAAVTRQAGLLPRRLDLPSTAQPVGRVVSTSPPAGTEVAKHSPLLLRVSTGPPTGTVPKVTGLPLQDAVDALTASHFESEHVTQHNSAKAGIVVGQDPQQGTTLERGQTVRLTVSSGPELVAVPPLTGDIQSAAEQAIVGAGLVVGDTSTQSSDTVAQGAVISSDPASGTQAPKGSAVALVISSGPAKEKVPNVLGLTEAAAEAKISQAGFNAQPSDKVTTDQSSDGRIVDQYPLGESLAVPGHVVIIRVGRYQAPVSTDTTPTDTLPTDTTTGTGSSAGTPPVDTGPAPSNGPNVGPGTPPPA
jgi:serine/threonine-protein kinase